MQFRRHGSRVRLHESVIAHVVVQAYGTKERGVELVVLPTAEAIKVLLQHAKKTNAILHVTC